MNTETPQQQSMASVVNRCLLLEHKLKNLELEKAILLDVVNEAKRCLTQSGHSLDGLKRMLERAEKIVPNG